MLFSLCRPPSGPLRRRPSRPAPGPVEAIEDRTLLSATFAMDAQHLQLGGFAQVTDESMVVRENGANFEFALTEGVWSGADGGGVSGAGTAVLVVGKAAVAGLAGGIDVDASAVKADVSVQSIDFSSLAGGLSITGAGAVRSTGTVRASDFELAADSITVEGAVLTADRSAHFTALRELRMAPGSTVVSTSGAITLRGNVAGDWSPGFGGVRLDGATVATETGAVAITGDSVRIWNGSDVRSTGLGAGDVVLEGLSRSLSIAGSIVRSVEGDIRIKGRSPQGEGVRLQTSDLRSPVVRSEGRGPAAATITIEGTATDVGIGVQIQYGGGFTTEDAVAVTSMDGDITIRGTGASLGVGVAYQGGVASTGTGGDAADIEIVGVGTSDGPGDGLRISNVTSVDGDIAVRGTASGKGSYLGGGSHGVTASHLRVSGDGDLTLVGRDDVAVVTAFTTDVLAGELSASGGTVTVVGDEIAIDGPIRNPRGRVVLAPRTDGRAIALGAGDSAAALGLLRGELNRIATLDLRVGGARSGDIRLAGFVKRRWGIGTLTLTTGGSVVDGTAGEQTDLVVDALRIVAGRDAGGEGDADLDLSATRLSADVGAGAAYPAGGRLGVSNDGPLAIGDLTAARTRIAVAGAVTIDAGARFDASRIPASDDPAPPLWISNDGADPVAGTFDGLDEGGLVLYVGGAPVRVTYRGADGNDVLAYKDLPPIQGEDSARVREDGVAAANVLANDVDPNGGTLRLIPPFGRPYGEWFTLPSGARAKWEADGTVSYDPNGAFRHLLPGETAVDHVGFLVRSESTGREQSGVLTVVVYGAGGSDLVAYHAGEWWVTVATATGFVTSPWARWRDVAWDALRQADVDADGRTDVVGLIDGVWYVGRNTGTRFATSLAAAWADTEWRDIAVRDVSGDGRADLVARVGGQWWVSLATGTPGEAGFAAATRWGAPAGLAGGPVFLDDADADGRADLIGYAAGTWRVALSTGTSFAASAAWARWSAVPWEAIGTGDFDRDGAADLYGFARGEWYVGLSTGRYGGAYFATVFWARWADADWRDARVDDFNGDGRSDLAARSGGAWWVSLTHRSTGDSYTGLWAAWADVDWRDVRTGDFNGDGAADLVGRAGGQWWLARATGLGSETLRWATWADAAWVAVAAAEADGDARIGERAAISDAAASGPVSPTALAQAPPTTTDDDSLALFWAGAEEDEEFAGRLVSV